MAKILLSVMLLSLTVLLWYGTTKHQRLFPKPLNHSWRLLALVAAIAASGLLTLQLAASASVFFSLLVLMLLMMLMPLASLLVLLRRAKPAETKSEHAKSTQSTSTHTKSAAARNQPERSLQQAPAQPPTAATSAAPKLASAAQEAL